MKNVFRTLIVVNLLMGIFLFGPFIKSAYALGIVLDPGHGGDSLGCTYEYDGKIIKEKDLNYKIAIFIKDELSKYRTQNGEKVDVYLTRNEFENPCLSERVELGVKVGADIVISLHNNASPSADFNYRGSMILVTGSHCYNKYEIEEGLAQNILKELNKIGLPMQTEDNILGQAANMNGLLRRPIDDGRTYPNGDVADWYGIIRHGIINNIPSILVEHAYLSNEQDYRDFLSTDEKLKELANADVNAIVKYYRLMLSKP